MPVTDYIDKTTKAQINCLSHGIDVDRIVSKPDNQLRGKNKVAFFWDYSGIGILGIDGICVLFGTENHSVHSAPDSRMNRMEGIRFTRNTQNTRSFGKLLAGNLTRPLAAGFHSSSQVTSAPPWIFRFQI